MARLLLGLAALALSAAATTPRPNTAFPQGSIEFDVRYNIRNMANGLYGGSMAHTMKRRMDLLLHYRHKELPSDMTFVQKAINKTYNYDSKEYDNSPEYDVFEHVYKLDHVQKQNMMKFNPYIFGTDREYAREHQWQIDTTQPKRKAQMTTAYAQIFLKKSNFATYFNDATRPQHFDLLFAFNNDAMGKLDKQCFTYLDMIDYYDHTFKVRHQNKIVGVAFPTSAEVKACRVHPYDKEEYLKELLRRFMFGMDYAVGHKKYVEQKTFKDMPPYYANRITMEQLNDCFPNFQDNFFNVTKIDVRTEEYAYRQDSIPAFLRDNVATANSLARRRIDLLQFYKCTIHIGMMDFVKTALDTIPDEDVSNINKTAAGSVFAKVFSSDMFTTLQREAVMTQNDFLFGTVSNQPEVQREKNALTKPVRVEAEVTHPIEYVFFAKNDFLLNINAMSDVEQEDVKFAFNYPIIATLSSNTIAAPKIASPPREQRNWASYDVLSYVNHIITDVVKSTDVPVPTLQQARKCHDDHPELDKPIREHVTYIIDRFIFTTWTVLDRNNYKDYDISVQRSPLLNIPKADADKIIKCFPQFAANYREYFNVDFPNA